MLKIQRLKVFVVVVTIMSLLTMYGAMRAVNAASLTNASDTLSDSGPNAVADHTVDFTSGIALGAGDYMEVTLPTAFGDIATGTCPTAAPVMTLSTTTETVRCTANGAVAAGPYQIIIPDVTNPSATTTYHVYINTKTSGDAEIESADVMVAIVDGVTVTATVPSTLTFAITGLDPGQDVNGVTTNATSTPYDIPFGALEVGVTTTIGQQLEVTTNASGGYSVTVQQSKNLTSDNGADIDAFDNGVAASTTAAAWTDPTGNLSDEKTYGHFGLTSEDASLSGAAFGSGNYKGFPNALVSDPAYPIEIMYHNGPADGSTANVGLSQVAYSVKISGLQEAGDYTNTLTYICTPTY